MMAARMMMRTHLLTVIKKISTHFANRLTVTHKLQWQLVLDSFIVSIITWERVAMGMCQRFHFLNEPATSTEAVNTGNFRSFSTLPSTTNFTCDGPSICRKVPKGSRELVRYMSNNGSILYEAYSTLIVSISLLLMQTKSLSHKWPLNFLVYMVTSNSTLDRVLSEILRCHCRCTWILGSSHTLTALLC